MFWGITREAEVQPVTVITLGRFFLEFLVWFAKFAKLVIGISEWGVGKCMSNFNRTE